MPRSGNFLSFLLLLFLATILAGSSCQSSGNKTPRHIEPAFYYWKSTFSISPYERQQLTSLNAHHLYTRFFDVGWNESSGQPQPLAIVRFSSAGKMNMDGLQIIPVIFITQECLRNLDSSVAPVMAARVMKLIRQIQSENDLGPVKELQIDCDWTANTRDQYFYFLQELQKLDASLIYSATIRLHQVKYLTQAGVPPVQKGLLMCYNMGNLRRPSTKNSILDPSEMKKYLGNMSNYPLPLDMALPLFDWSVLFRKDVFVGLMKISPGQLKPGTVSKQDNNWYTFNADTVIQGFQCVKGDRLRYEPSNLQDILSACRYLSPRWKDSSARVSFFHLDSFILQKYSTNELETVLNSLR